MTLANVPVTSISAAEAVDGPFLVVDVRSPREFAEGHVPHAVNLPLLSDAQRAVVGTVYKETGAREARVRAVDLISAGLPLYLRSLRTLQRDTHRLAIMCWRGGERSRNVVLLLALIGVHAVQVEGGYKAYRRWVLDGLQSLASDHAGLHLVRLHGGRQDRGAPRARPARPDAASSATRRRRPGGDGAPPRLAARRAQPTRGAHAEGFRGVCVWDALRRADGDYLLLEGEGNKIGRIVLPDTVGDAVRAGRPVQVTASVRERAERLLRGVRPRRVGYGRRRRLPAQSRRDRAPAAPRDQRPP